MGNDIQGEITKTGIRFLLEEPFYGHVFSGMLRVVSEETKTVSVGMSEGRPALFINPEYWNEEPDEELRYGMLKHQLLHLALKHPFQRTDYPNKHIFDIAADLVVNQYIRPSRLASDAVTMERFPQFRKFMGKDVGFYYRKLLELQEQGNDGNFPDENDDSLQQHRPWSNIGNQAQSEKRIMESIVDDMMVQSVERSDEKLMGVLPGGLLRYLKEKLNPKPPVLDWRRVLRLFTGSGRKTSLKNTLRRPSKRYGTVPGIKIKKKQRIVVGIDTSGSVTPKELQLFFSEIHHIFKQGAEVLIAECDAAIQRTYEYKGIPPVEVAGGGGTSLDPVLEWANNEAKPDIIVYLTDGFAPEPSIQVIAPVLWLITDDGIEPGSPEWKNLPGRKVVLKT